MTNDPELYQTERWSNEDLIYEIPVQQNGKYVLVLKFSEVYFNSPSEKVFDIALGKENVVKQLDIYSKVGKSAAYDEFIEFELKNNKVYYYVSLIFYKFLYYKLIFLIKIFLQFQNRPIESAYNEETGAISVVFKKGERDNPKINAIVLVKGGLAETDYDLYKRKFEELERIKLEKERKQREFQKKSQDYDYEDFEDDFVDTDNAQGANTFDLFSPSKLFVFGFIGIMIYKLFLRPGKENNANFKED